VAPFKFLPVTWHDTLPSTNTFLLERVKALPDTPSGTVIAARTQTAGRGRQQREWRAEANRNLTFSFLWNGEVDADHIPSLAQALSVGIAQSLDDAGLSPFIKWPNDVLVDQKKIAGILCEIVNVGEGMPTAIVAGIGLNVNMNGDEANQVDQPATSMAMESGRDQDVETVLDQLLSALTQPIYAWANGGFTAIRSAYEKRSYAPGAPITVRDGALYIEGLHRGFNDDGALLLETDGGDVRTLYSGDVLSR
jgi:BirA family transcriptional regulator, biotin operon repressor / biotin---[acetyl-CoA-carboxylase] ligase